MTDQLNGQTALITGGSRGIGKATALRLATMGCDVAITYNRKQDEALAVAAEIQSLGRNAFAVQADVGNTAGIKLAFAAVKENFGRLDIFISNAAKGVFGPAMRIGTNGFDLTMATGPKALLVGAQEAVKLFALNDNKLNVNSPVGTIVVLSSIGSMRYLPSYAAVGTAKAAIESLVRFLAVELGPKQIRVNAVSGGPIDTDALDDFKDAEALKLEWTRRTPLGRLGTADDLAAIVAFLCTDEAKWIHGQTIIADGGLTLL
ncbi:MAG: SDR family oxidoreductase [Rhizobacter sp.]|nr:SDR family oxidoreductase [Chlorobiales bacterium]